MNQAHIIENLHRGVCRVVFEKANGEIREMRCTLDPSFMPETPEYLAEENGSKDYTPVWDTDLNEWRSFRFDSIKEFNPPQLLNENY